MYAYLYIRFYGCTSLVKYVVVKLPKSSIEPQDSGWSDAKSLAEKAWRAASGSA